MLNRSLALVALVVLALSSAAVGAAIAPTVCNGHAEFCSRAYSNVSIVGAHDSYSVSAGNRKVFPLRSLSILSPPFLLEGRCLSLPLLRMVMALLSLLVYFARQHH